MYLVIDGKVADLHRHGNEIDGTVELILFKLLLQVHVLLSAAGGRSMKGGTLLYLEAYMYVHYNYSG